MRRRLLYPLATLGISILFGIVYAFWPWSGATLSLVGVATLCIWLYNTGWVRTAHWSAITGVLLVGVFLGWYYWPTKDTPPAVTTASEAATPPVIVKTMVGPDKPFIKAVEPGYGLNYWPKEFAPSKVLRSGLDIVVTFSSDTERELGYEYYLCTVQKPCGEVPKLTEEPKASSQDEAFLIERVS